MSDASTIITGTSLCKTYESGIFTRQSTYAVRDVDFSIQRGETYALVGESGSGKTTLGKLLIMLIHLTSGHLYYKGTQVDPKQKQELGLFRKKMQIIPQHPEDALNPRWKVSYSVLEPFRIHDDLELHGTKKERLNELLDMTGLNHEYANRYPHQLSGGELQRAVIARTLALKPEFIVCDEPTSMLDVSVQASIIHLLQSIQKKTHVALLFITHDIRIASLIGDRIGVMYQGQIVEEGEHIMTKPLHPYTRSLCGCASPRHQINPKAATGCPFYADCPVSEERCRTQPPLVSWENRKIRCHFPEKLT